MTEIARTSKGTTGPSGHVAHIESSLAHQLLWSSPWSAALLSSDGRIQAINFKALDLFGLPHDSKLESEFLSGLWAAEDAHLVQAAVERAATGEEVRQVASFMLDGALRCVELNLAFVDEKGGLDSSMLLCGLRDVTQLTAVEADLKASEQRFRALADNMAQLAWIADSKGVIFWFNRRWFEFTGTTLDEMKGAGWSTVFHPDHAERVVAKWHATIQSGEIWEDTLPLRSANGVYRWFLSRAMPIVDHTNTIVLWCGTNTDITEQRLATQRLRQKARLIEMSHEAIFSWELDGTIVSWNRGCQELYGYTQSEAIGRSSHELLKSSHSISIDEVLATLHDENEWSGEVRHFAKDGTKVWVDSRQQLLKIGGRRIVLETNRDITDRRKSDEVRHMLVAELNHRVKNTLAIVQSIAGQSARTSANVNQFVASFRGRLHTLSNAHNVLADADWFGADLHHLITSEITVTVGNLDNVRVHGERIFLTPQLAIQFALILHELGNNAARFGALSSGQGHLDISWVRSGENGEKLDLVWRESGGPAVQMPTRRGFGTVLIERYGMLPHLQTNLNFEPTGLVCRIVADLAGEGESEPSMFNPVRKEAPLVCHPRGIYSVRPVGDRQNILVIEDDPLTALEFEDALTEAGYHPNGPSTAVGSTLEAIKRGGIDLAIVDRELLGLSCSVVLEALEQKRIPYVLICDNFTSGEASGACQRTVRRPVSPSQIVLLVAELLGAQHPQVS